MTELSSPATVRKGCEDNDKSDSSHIEHYLFDHAFTIGIVWNAIVMIWRGVWTIGDLFFFPDDPHLSASCSLAIGYGLSVISIPLQPLFNCLYQGLVNKGYPKISRVVTEDVIYLLGNISSIHIWRGIWLMLDIYLLPDNFESSNWVTHGVGIFGLMLLLSGRSVVEEGSVITGEDDAKSGAYFANIYFQYYFGKSDQAEKTDSNGNIAEKQVLNGRKTTDVVSRDEDVDNGHIEYAIESSIC